MTSDTECLRLNKLNKFGKIANFAEPQPRFGGIRHLREKYMGRKRQHEKTGTAMSLRETQSATSTEKRRANGAPYAARVCFASLREGGVCV